VNADDEESWRRFIRCLDVGITKAEATSASPAARLLLALGFAVTRRTEEILAEAQDATDVKRVRETKPGGRP
jgi:hypothetical protein